MRSLLALGRQMGRWSPSLSLSYHTGTSLTFDYAHLLGEGHDASINFVKRDDGRRSLNVEWSAGGHSSYAYRWLREFSPDAKTMAVSPALTARNVQFGDLPDDLAPTSVNHTADCVSIDWPDGHRSSYSSKWLAFRDLDKMRSLRAEHHITESSDSVLWDAAEIGGRLKYFEFDRVVADPSVLYDWLCAVMSDGLAVVRGAPPSQESARTLGKLIGIIDSSHYGGDWLVTMKEDSPMNLAYAHRSALPMHTDDASLIHPPHLQMLHCVAAASTSGATTFVDGFKLAEVIRRQSPNAFEVLSTVPFECISEGFSDTLVDAHGDNYVYKFAAMHTLFTVDRSTGRTRHVFYSNHQRSWHFDCPASQLNDVYDAWAMFERLATNPEYQYKLLLKPGETVLWLNRRLLHGREAYTVARGDKERCLAGCYFRLDHVTSRMRELRARMGHPKDQPSL